MSLLNQDIDDVFFNDRYWDCPPDSAIGAFFDATTNWWMDDDGFFHSDLKDFGFTALENQTIRKLIANHANDEYMCLPNNNGDLVELFWNKTFVKDAIAS